MRGLVLVLRLCAVGALGDISSSFVGNQSGEALVRNFNLWIERNGGDRWSQIQVGLIPGYRLGAVAKQRISKDQLYLEVPWRMVISEDSIQASQEGPAFLELREKHSLDVGDLLMLHLLHERFRPASFWRPYIDILPREYHIPFYWSQAELHELKGTGLPEEVHEYMEQHKALFARLGHVVRQEPLLAAVAEEWNWGLFMWGSSVLDSRTIWINGRKRCFLPMLDMVNNQDHPSRVHHTSLHTPGQVTHTRAIWPVEPGEQLFENYGSSNKHNLLYHGFVLDQNSYDSSTFALGPARGEAAAVLSAFRVPTVHKVTPGEAPVSLLADARIRALDPAQLADAYTARRNYGQPISSSNERAAMGIVVEACQKQLPTQYKTRTDEEDAALLATELRPNVRLAVRFRRQQRAIVQEFCDGIQARHREL